MADDKKGDTPFEKHLFQYLNSSITGRCFLLSGPWGSGKTYDLKEFIKKHYAHTHRQFYYVSCFGLKDRKDLEDEINEIIKHSDDSFSSMAIGLAGKIPVVGELLYELLRKRYDFRSVNKHSVFVFDDFERIAEVCTRSKQVKNEEFQTTYINTSNKIDGFKTVADEISRLEKTVSGLDQSLNMRLDKDVYDQYTAITGIINLMVDTCGYKVIILCDTNKMGEGFVNDVLKSKLNCFEFRKNATLANKKSLADQTLNQIQLADQNKNEKIKSFIQEQGLEMIIRLISTGNMRNLIKCMEAFVITADLFESDVLTIDFMGSLLVSIILAHRKNEFHRYKRTGAVLSFCTGRKDLDNFRWIDDCVSNYWFENYMVPDNIEEIVKEWEEYPYIELEKALSNGDFSCLDDHDFEMVHFWYYLDKLYWKESFSAETNGWKPLLVRMIEKYDLITEDGVRTVLKDWTDYRTVSDSAINEVVFTVLEEESKGMRSNGTSEFDREYNSYLNNRIQTKPNK